MPKKRLNNFNVFQEKSVEGNQLQLAASFALKNNLLEIKDLQKQKERSYTQNSV